MHVRIWMAGVVGVAALFLTGCSSDNGDPAGVTRESSATGSAEPPAPDDFVIDVRVKSETCYGSAGCNVTLGIEPLNAREGGVPDGRWEVTYKLVGTTDGTTTQTFTLDDGYFEDLADEVEVSTSKKGAEITAKVTSVRPD